METNKFIIDFNKGTQSEIDILPKLKIHFLDETIERSLDRYAIFDYTNNKDLLIELKTRNCEYEKYDETMINVIKINKSKKLSKTHNIYFLFLFTNGLYYWKYDINELDKLTYKIGGRSDRTNLYSEKKMYTYIDIKLLTRINI